MHGKKRVKTTEEIAKQKKQEELKKIEGYCRLVQAAMDLYKSNVLTDDGLKASAKVLDLNPEFYTLWNYRRKIFLNMQEQGQTEELQSKLAAELKFIEGGIRNHPKSYWLFHHRTWVTSHQSSPNWQFELILTTEMLKADERNFHCWGYRRYITSQANTSDSSEFQFTTKKIEENFSNYSAWHQRSKLIPQLYSTPDQLQPVLEEEFELIQNAFYTEPKDSSAWFYYRWLLSQLDKLDKSKSKEMLEKELEKLTEFQNFLQESETGPDALMMQKFPLQTRTVIMMKLGGHEKEVAENLRILVKSDPDRRNYYIDMAQTLLPNQVVEDVAKLVQELKVC